MAASAPYIPPKDADLNSWLANFSTLITAGPATYGLVAGDATNIATAVAAWAAAYALVTAPSTKTKDSVSAKDTQKVSVLGVVRPYAQQISNNAGVTSANKIALGLNPKTSTPTPIPSPATNPILSVTAAANYQIFIKFTDSGGGAAKSKPAGVVGVEVWGLPSATPITDPTELQFKGTVTKNPFFVAFPSSLVGQRVYIAARYRTQKGLTGPWSPIISYIVAGS